MRRALAASFAALALASCAGTSDAQKPLPQISFPKQVAAGSVQRAHLHISNPGSKALDSVVVAFSDLGRVADKTQIPAPIVGPGFKGHNPAIIDVRPKPVAVSDDGLVYRFGGLAGGESEDITFSLKVPVKPGLAANAVIVSDGSDLKRSRGVPLSTQVNG